jgi:hypothetical protein
VLNGVPPHFPEKIEFLVKESRSLRKSDFKIGCGTGFVMPNVFFSGNSPEPGLHLIRYRLRSPLGEQNLIISNRFEEFSL